MRPETTVKGLFGFTAQSPLQHGLNNKTVNRSWVARNQNSFRVVRGPDVLVGLILGLCDLLGAGLHCISGA